MANTLLNTIGTQSKQFSTMTLPSAMPAEVPVVPTTAPTVENHVIDQSPKEQPTKKTSKDLWLALGGLAVIGAGSVLIYNKIKRGKADIKPNILPDSPPVPPPNTETPPIVNIGELRTKIRDKYLHLKSQIIEDFNDNLHPTLKLEDAVPFKKTKDFDRLQNFFETDEQYGLVKYTKMRSDIRTAYRAKLSELDKDSEWHSLRELRKNLLQQMKKPGEQAQIAQKKIEIVNDLLVLKTDTSQEGIFKGRNLMDVSDAMSFVNRDFGSLEEYSAEQAKLSKHNFTYDIAENFFTSDRPITTSLLFADLRDKYKFAGENIKRINNIIGIRIPEAKKSLIERLKGLGENFRISEDVQTLKKAVASSTEAA